ncbi:gephyrin-like molybdotransferase receptor GlpR [Streptomyces sp. NPDC053542]|uniref:divisome protein SepX/GlpR n=1 Tax=Streptomyces sp. NPDC053542 TaxID=3365710 RepID=UPI0037CF9B07
MSSSGLIYAVIVGAWAAYLVPMWLRRQDELNEARPTERFSTAIRLLSGRAAMERRYAKGQEGRPADDASGERDPDAPADAAGVRSASTPADEDRPPGADARVPEEREAAPTAVQPHGPVPPHAPAPPRPSSAERTKRARVLARRRRTITVLFLVFTVGAVVAGVGGITFLWAPGVPALLLSAYIVYLRLQERRRFAFTMDQRGAEAAAQRLREGRARPPRAGHQPPAEETPAEQAGPAPEPMRAEPAPSAGRRPLVEQAGHTEWAEPQRPRGRRHGDGWEPVPVPLPTYVTAPVAPRANGHVDLAADDAWSSARSGTAGGTGAPADGAAAAPSAGAGPVAGAGAADADPRPAPGRDRPAGGRRGRTPLFDQFAVPADEGLDRPRAANE